MRPSRLDQLFHCFLWWRKRNQGLSGENQKRSPWYNGLTAPPRLEVAGSTRLLIFALIVYSKKKRQLVTDGVVSHSVGPVADSLNCFWMTFFWGQLLFVFTPLLLHPSAFWCWCCVHKEFQCPIRKMTFLTLAPSSASTLLVSDPGLATSAWRSPEPW